MRLQFVLKRQLHATFVTMVALQIGCTGETTREHVSDDLAALQAIVHVPAATRSARWEMFGTPEYQGGVPGPTDYITLVAELDVGAIPPGTTPAIPGHVVYVVPEAARSWLSDAFRTFLSERKNQTFSLPASLGCQPYTSMMTKSGRPVSGFICVQVGRALLYLDLLPAEQQS